VAALARSAQPSIASAGPGRVIRQWAVPGRRFSAAIQFPTGLGGALCGLDGEGAEVGRRVAPAPRRPEGQRCPAHQERGQDHSDRSCGRAATDGHRPLQLHRRTIVSDLKRIDTAWTALEQQIDQDCG
jgi:hypothetical protein